MKLDTSLSPKYRMEVDVWGIELHAELYASIRKVHAKGAGGYHVI